MTTQTLKTLTGAELGLQLRKGDKPEAGKVRPVRNTDHRTKPEGGIWTSSLTENGSSDWERWCEEQDFRTSDSNENWVLKPSADAVFLHVQTVDDVAALVDRFGKEGMFGPEFDWEAMAEEFDGLRLSNPWVGDAFWGWDCESTVFFRWEFDEVAEG